MAPELKEKDVVLINKNIKEVSLGGGIYAIKWKGNILVKRLQVNPQTGTVLIKSDNRSYETLETNLDDIEIEGKIIEYEVTGDFKFIFVITKNTITRDGERIFTSQPHRRPIKPNADISGESKEIKDIASAVWSEDLKQAYTTFRADQLKG